MPEKQDKLDALWNKVAEVLLTDLQDPEVRTAGMVNCAIRFLNDNQVEALPTKGSSLDEIADSIPFPKQGVGG